MHISIHALREEGDVFQRRGITLGFLFLSTPSARRATCLRSTRLMPAENFYPRPPRGGRPAWERQKQPRYLFLSTPSARRATAAEIFWQELAKISIHALREEGDQLALHRSHCNSYFYPRPPRGGRPPRLVSSVIPVIISIHALREEGDSTGIALLISKTISIHALREEGDKASK